MSSITLQNNQIFDIFKFNEKTLVFKCYRKSMCDFGNPFPIFKGFQLKMPQKKFVIFEILMDLYLFTRKMF